MLSDAPPDVVVCDMLLPDITGMEVFEKALASEPSYRRRFIAATGGAGVPKVAAFLRSFGGPILHKPIETGPLLTAVRACLANGVPRVARGG
jgi:DNA-binding NtrC family response regulator